MRIAVVGSGISGLVVADALAADHDVTLFEADTRIGGHTHTVDVRVDGRDHAIDTGFIVYNERTYPNFVRLLERWGVATRPSTMSFSVRCEVTGLEYNGHTLDTIFAQRRNLLRPSFYRMLREILRFNRDAKRWLLAGDSDETVADFLGRGRYSRAFVDYYLRPMGGAIWSCGDEALGRFPARFLLGFFRNHGMLEVDDRPQWRTIVGGSSRYVERMLAGFRGTVRTATPIASIRRGDSGVVVTPSQGEPTVFDRAFVAVHGPDALALLAAPTAVEREVLGAFRYAPSDVVLHTDRSLLPRARRAWAAWNCHRFGEARPRATVTYSMNILQGIDAATTFCVTLNRTDAIDPSTILGRWTYNHPHYDGASVEAQARQRELNGDGIYYCGAYWGYGFHEDGVKSALAALAHHTADGERCTARSTRAV